MKSDVRQRNSAGSMFRFALRIVGLTGALAVAVGAVLATVTWSAITNWDSAQTTVTAASKYELGATAFAALTLLGIGGIVVLIWILSELVSGLLLVTGRKSIAGTNNTLQVALAAALLVAVNAISFQHYSRIDATRDQRFTLSRDLRDKLKKLDPKSPTTIVVLQMDKTSAAEPERSDALSAAAQSKIVEKVRDIVEEIREFGPQFDVHVIHTKDEDFEAKLDSISPLREDKEGSKKTPAPLRRAILEAPENSVFFAAHDRVQRLGFNGFYLLDKTASGEQKNLILKPQGKEAFVRKVLAVEERRPRIAIGVIHPWLSTSDNKDEFSAPGMRKALELNGYEVVDLILKKGWDGESQLGPASSSVRESKLEEVESKLQAATDDLAEAEGQIAQMKLIRVRTEKGPLPELDKMFRRVVGRVIDREEDRKLLIEKLIDPTIASRESDLVDAKKRVAQYEPEFLEFTRDDALMAGRREPNIKARLKETLADCDLLILSRLTVMSLSDRRAIPSSLHNLSKEQASVIQDYIAAGKPVICCFGAADVGPRQPRPDETPGPDDVEKLIRRLGIDLAPQIIVTDVEFQSMATRQSSPFGSSSDPPSLLIDGKQEGGNPVAAAFELSNRSVAGQLKVVRSGFRPVYLEPSVKMSYSAELLRTRPEAWNKNWPDNQQFGSPRYLPKFEATKPTDARLGTRNEEKKGSFPVGIAAEVPIPAAWLDPIDFAKFAAAQIGAASPGGFGLQSGVAFSTLDLDPNLGLPADKAHVSLNPAAQSKSPSTVRLVVFGHGGLFNGKELDPGRETLLLDSVHWSLKRDYLLPHDTGETWSYPRVELTPVEYAGWRWGSFLGLPLLAAYFGLIVLMLRRLR